MSIAEILPITWLTLRQFRAGKAILIVALLAIVSIILVAIYLLGTRDVTGQELLSQTYFQLLAPTVVPLASLILAASAIGNEISDHTLPYLTLKPIGRWRIVLEKYFAVIVVTTPAFVLGLAASWAFLKAWGESVDFATMVSLILATACGIFAHAAIFLLLSLKIQRAMLVGIVYVLFWESLLARVVPRLQAFSVRHFAQSVFVQTASGSPIDLPDAFALEQAVVVLGCLVIFSLAAATFLLKKMSLD
jgi:ABC-2 type transport system permease protein